MIDSTSVLAYASPLSVAPGQEITFHVGSETLSQAELSIVRVRCGDPDANGPGLKLFPMNSAIDGPATITHQPIHIGSYGIVEDNALLSSLGAFSFGCYVYPTLIGDTACQTVFSRWNERTQSGWRLDIDGEGHACVVAASGGGTSRARSPRPLLNREWMFLGAAIDQRSGSITLHGESLAFDGGRHRLFDVTETGSGAIAWPDETPLIFAARWSGEAAPAKPTSHHFNGKIDRPRLYEGLLERAELRALVETLDPSPVDPHLLAAWDFSKRIPSDDLIDLSANNLNGEVRGLPARAATGANWTGMVQSWTEAPREYGAIHFHEDDLADAGWQPTCKLRIPDDWRSGFYALRMQAEHDGHTIESYASFFVRPGRNSRKADVVVIAPTATYLAYANNHVRLDQTHFEVMADSLLIVSQDDIFLSTHREYGHSTYDTHRDGSGVTYSSAARPILNMRARGYSFNYVNDTHLLDWLEETGVDYDVVTDEDMHREGARLLKDYRVAITMSHPEYYSKEMYDALEAYQNGGGRHMYVGGNGFYWRIAFHPTKRGVIELRRGITGLRSWEAEAGESNLASTGEPSGLWRSHGRAPQRLAGVGFSAQVFDFSTFYRRMPDSFAGDAAFVFKGVGEDEVIGNFGLRLGGAAGLEIDRADRTLGSPPEMLLLATADRTGPGGIPAPEELPVLYRGFSGEESSVARADMVLFRTASGGAVFSVGSIAWCCALSHNGYDNNVSTITGNVLRRFLEEDAI